MKFAVVGSGKFGRELTKILLNNQHEVLIFSRRKEEIESINKSSKSLSGFIFPEAKNLSATTNPQDLTEIRYIFLTFSSKDIIDVLTKIPITDKQIFVSCVKGFENELGLLPSEILIEKFGVSKENLIVLSGPNLSREIAKEELTATVLAGENYEAMNEVAVSLKNKFFIPFLNILSKVSLHLTVEKICSTNKFLIFDGLVSELAVTLLKISTDGLSKLILLIFSFITLAAGDINEQ